jgi:ParB family chromosome partitioning protein
MNTFRVTPGQQLARINARHDGRRDLEQFDPDRYSLNQAAIDYTIEEAKRIKEWPALEKAIDAKITEQIKFVAWWKVNVSRPGGDRQSDEALSRSQDNALSTPQAETLTGMSKQRVSSLRGQLGDPERYRAHLLGAEYFAAYLEIPPPRGTQGTGENEWFTPEFYITLARSVLGEIDLDPATSAQAQKLINAGTFYTAENDGLQQEWHGRVWLNPPFAQPLIEHFVFKMAAEYTANRITAGIMLTHNYTDTTWFHEAAKVANAICFTRGRVKFYKPDGTIAAPTQGQAFFYFGADVSAFFRQFKKIGFVVEVRHAAE